MLVSHTALQHSPALGNQARLGLACIGQGVDGGKQQEEDGGTIHTADAAILEQSIHSGFKQKTQRSRWKILHES